MRRAKTFLGAMLLGTTLALSAPGVEVKRACEAAAQSCDAAARPAARAAAAASCPANAAQEAALADEEAAVARLRRELAARAAAGKAVVPLNGRGYNYGPEAGGGAVLPFEAQPTLPR